MSRLLKFLCVSVLWVSLPAQACRFVQRPFEVQLQMADVVFIGTVTKASNDRSGKMADTPATFVVEKVLKGSIAVGQTLEVATSNSSCGLNFTPPQRWLILSSGKTLEASAPSGSFLIRSAIEQQQAIESVNQILPQR